MQEERGSEFMSKDQAPPSVPIVATQGGQAAHRKIVADPSVWTDSMLRALDEGVRGYSVLAERHLCRSGAFRSEESSRCGVSIPHG